ADARRLAVRPRDRYRRRLGPVDLGPGLDRVGPGRQALDRETAVRARDGVEGMGQDAEVGLHPTVHVALQWHHHLGRAERARRRHGRRLADVEGEVLNALRLDVVENTVGVFDLTLLT